MRQVQIGHHGKDEVHQGLDPYHVEVQVVVRPRLGDNFSSLPDDFHHGEGEHAEEDPEVDGC